MRFLNVQKDWAVEEILKQLPSADGLDVSLCYTPGASLRVEKDGSKATLTYGRRVELFRGLGLLAEHSQDNLYQTVQKPAFQMNGVMLDCSRNGVARVETVKRLLRYMALMGLDMLMLYTEDTYEVPEYPYFGYMRGRYTQQELQELDAYAAAFGIEMIPCIQTLAHLAATLRWSCFDGMKDNEDILLCGEEKTYQFIEAMIAACRRSYKTNRIHIGMDEAFMLGLGQYRVKNGIVSREEIFCKHLDRVNAICKKYDFKPMIWSDMFFRIAFGGEYSADRDISPDVIKMVPQDVELVYWDYYRHQQKDYEAAIAAHQKFPNPVLFAGGAWRWTGYVPHTVKSLEASRAALAACREKGVREVFCTAWGDNGNEATFLCILPVLQQYAEYNYQGDVSDEVLAQRMLACTGERFQDMLLMDMPNSVDDNHWIASGANPSKYLLYMDILGGIAELHTTEKYPQRYEEAAKCLAQAAERSPSCGYAYDMLAKLSRVLAIKSRIGIQAQKAYKSGDTDTLREIADVTLPELLVRMQAFHESMYIQWITECKANGYEVLDLRIGGLESRIRTSIQRIRAYLAGEISCLDELEDERLSMDGRSAESVAKSEVHLDNFWAHSFSANII